MNLPAGESVILEDNLWSSNLNGSELISISRANETAHAAWQLRLKLESRVSGSLRSLALWQIIAFQREGLPQREV